jgi:hypothetical protein
VWLTALALPLPIRQSLTRLVDATTSVDRDGLETAMRTVIDLSSPQLDPLSVAELRDVLRAMAAQ